MTSLSHNVAFPVTSDAPQECDENEKVNFKRFLFIGTESTQVHNNFSLKRGAALSILLGKKISQYILNLIVFFC